MSERDSVVYDAGHWCVSLLLTILTALAVVAASCSGASPSSPQEVEPLQQSGERVTPDAPSTPVDVDESAHSPGSSSDETAEDPEPLVDSAEESELRLTRSAVDAFVPESAHSSVAARYGPTTGNYTIPIYYCAEPGKYSESDLAEAVNDLNENVATFFARVSAGEVSIEFVSGTIVSPEQMTDELPWDRVNLSYLHQHLTAIDENPCLIDAHNHALSDLFLVLADMPAGRGPGAVFGYAWYYGGPAIVVTETIHKQRVPTNGREQYFHTVAHELGHALLDLCHTHQTSERTDEFGGPCGVEEEVHGIRYDQTAFQAYHDNYVYDADDKSAMSYQYSMSREERDSYKLESDYINCRQLYIKELDVNNCVGADIIDPNYVESPVPPEPEGLPPSPPTDVAAIGLDGEILVKWSPPFDDGGVPLTGYRIEYRDGSVTEPLGPTSNHSYRIGGLTNGVAYVVSVRAENTVGTSEAATASAVPQLEEVSGTVPGPVVDLTATGANREIRVNWSQPFDDGGIELTGYSVLYRPEGGDWERWTHSGRSTSAIITGLTAGTDYEVEVTAQNIIGHGKSEYAGASTEEDQCTAAAGETQARASRSVPPGSFVVSA